MKIALEPSRVGRWETTRLMGPDRASHPTETSIRPLSAGPSHHRSSHRILETAVAAQDAAAVASAELLVGLGNALAARATFAGSAEDARGVSELRRAAQAAAGSSRLPALRSNLAAALLGRFELTGQIADVQEAVDLLEAALARSEPRDRGRGARLSNLAIALRLRALRRRGGREDLDRSVAAYEEALRTDASAADRAGYRANLGNALHQRLDVTGDPADLDRAVEVLEAACAATPAGSPDRALYVNDLSATLAARADRSDATEDLRRAAQLLRDELAASTATSVHRPWMLANLANAASELFDRLGDAADGDTALEAYRSAATTGLRTNPADALAAASNWSSWSAAHRRWSEVVEAHALGQAAATRLLRSQVIRADKESWLRAADGLAALALAEAATGNLRGAALALEAGRGLLVSERLERDRADLGRLEDERRDLARRFRAAAALVDRLEGPRRARDGKTTIDTAKS